MTEYIIMASGEIITDERIAAWANTSSKDIDTVKAELLESGEIVLFDDYKEGKS